MSTWAQTRAVAKPAGRDRILVGGKDVTTFRDAETQWDAYELYEPFAYGPTTLSFPEIHGTLERLGVGELAWLHNGAEVRIQRVMSDTSIVTDYVGVVLSTHATGRALSVEVGGQFTGRAALIDKDQRAFRNVNDVGHYAALSIRTLNLRSDPWWGPVTGIDMVDGTGAEPLDSWAARVCAMSLGTDGTQRTIMPTTWGGPVWGFGVKDTTTKHLTIYTDDARMVVDLHNDAAEQPNRWFGTGVTPDGVRIRNIRYPGLQQGPPAPYPMAGGAGFGSGTTDADTLTGDGITVLQIKLQEMSYYGWTNPVTGTYDAITVAAVKRLQADVNRPVTGAMTTTTWNRLFDIGATGFSLNGARVFPLLADPATEPWLYSANGSIVARNPAYDPSVLPVERHIDFGSGMTKQQMVDWCRGDQARSSAKNWVGQITLNDFGPIAGEHNPGDTPLTDDDPRIMSHRDIRPGMNAWLPLFDGGTLVHISGVRPQRNDTNRSCVLTVDTQARDRLEIAAVLDRDTEARRDPRREWYASNRAAKPSGNMVPRDEFFGRLQQKITLPGDKWTAFPVPAGQSGQINRVHIQLVNAAAAFAMVILGEGRSDEQVAKQLNRRIDNPLAAVADGAEAWFEKDSNAGWFRDRTLLYAAGTHDQPCGYWPRKHTNAAGNTTSAAVTGEWIYDSPFPYLTGTYAPGVVWVAIYPDRDTHIKAGQILWAQEDDNA